jgi:hypothetical protein
MVKLYRNGIGPVNEAIHRRRFLATLAAIWCTSRVMAAPDDAEAAAVAEVLRSQGLGPVRTDAGGGYLAIGDAPAAFLQAARRLCEGLARDFLDHFQARKFPVARPAIPMTLIVLSGPAAYAKYLGIAQDEAEGGHYDLDTNRLVLFDNRARADAGALSARANTVALMHEAAHQLCFNTGLLDRARDIPTAISEGLAVYCETRRPDGRGRVGQVNFDRLAALSGQSLFPVSDLLTRDTLFDEQKTQQVAYSQAWVLVHLLMQTPEAQARLRAYLDRLRSTGAPAGRLDDARTTLGDLQRLDSDLRKHALKLGAR